MSYFAYLVFIASHTDGFQLLAIKNGTGDAVLIWGLGSFFMFTGCWQSHFLVVVELRPHFPNGQGTFLAPRGHP